MLHVPLISSISSLYCYFLNSTDHAAPDYAVPPSCHFLPLRTPYFPQHPVLQQPHNATDQVSHPQQTSINFVLLHVFFCSVFLVLLCCVVSTVWVADRRSGFVWLRIRHSAGVVNEVMNLRGPLSPADGRKTVIRNNNVFCAVRIGFSSGRCESPAGSPGSIAGQTMDTVALLWYPLAVL
jgi:hypothetical protein